jgi:hypothetical protein
MNCACFDVMELSAECAGVERWNGPAIDVSPLRPVGKRSSAFGLSRFGLSSIQGTPLRSSVVAYRRQQPSRVILSFITPCRLSRRNERYGHGILWVIVGQLLPDESRSGIARIANRALIYFP